MSVQAIAWVLEKSKSKLATRLVLLSVANHAHADGTGAYPSVETLATEAGVSERQARYSIRQAEEMGELKTDLAGGPKGANLYSLPRMKEGADSAPLQIVPPAELSRKGGRIKLKRGAQTAPEPSHVTVKEPSSSVDIAAMLSKPATPEELMDAWNTLSEAIPARRMSSKRRAAALARIKEEPDLTAWAEAAAAVAESSFLLGQNERGWKADFDWFLKPDTLTRIEEGKYDDRVEAGVSRRKSPTREEYEADRAKRGLPPSEQPEVPGNGRGGPHTDGVD